MLDWNEIIREHQQTLEKLADQSQALDHQMRAGLQKRASSYGEVIELHNQV